MAVADGIPVRTRRPSALRLLAAQIGYQLRLLVRSPLASFATLIVPLMVLLAVNLLYRGTHLASRGGIRYAQFFTPAMVAFAVVNACYMAVIASITLAREEGILKRVRSTPLPPWVYLAGRIASAALVAAVGAIIVVAVGAALYDFHVVWGALPAVVLTVGVAMFCFCALGLAVTVLVPGSDSAFALAWGTMLPLCFISDVFQPIDNAPHWLRAIASFFPLRPLADDLERLFNPLTGSTAVSWGHLAVLAAWGLGAGAFALLAFRWQPGGIRGERGSRLPAMFGLDRFHEVLEARGDRVAPGRPGHRRRVAPRDERRRAGNGRPEPEFTERIEGPAPADDSSVPPDPPRRTEAVTDLAPVVRGADERHG